MSRKEDEGHSMDDGTIFTLPANVFKSVQEVARLRYHCEFENLTHEQALSLMSAYMRALAQSQKEEPGKKSDPGQVTVSGRVVVSPSQDGIEAFRNAVKKEAERLAPKIDDDRTLTVHVEKDPTFWRTLVGKEPVIAMTLVFKPQRP